jgi:hypothetical protein
MEEFLLCSKLHDDQGFAFAQAAYGAANGFGEMTSSHRHCIFRCMILTDHVILHYLEKYTIHCSEDIGSEYVQKVKGARSRRKSCGMK